MAAWQAPTSAFSFFRREHPRGPAFAILFFAANCFGPAECNVAPSNLLFLPTWDKASGCLNVIIETTKGSRMKLDYAPEEGLFELGKILPRGIVFPFDFGFVPSTLGEDGDPLDILVLLAESVPAGCKIPGRLIGVIEAEQTESGEVERNDRLIAVAEGCPEHAKIGSVKDLQDYLIREIELFFVSYNGLSNKQFKVLGRRGPNRARKLVEEGARRFASLHHGQSSHKVVDGQPAAAGNGSGPRQSGAQQKNKAKPS
jgi:inorganic pyrophosphatase